MICLGMAPDPLVEEGSSASGNTAVSTKEEDVLAPALAIAEALGFAEPPLNPEHLLTEYTPSLSYLF